jgi:tRNA A-37 threonylcarbamoyl transferase component Bud32
MPKQRALGTHSSASGSNDAMGSASSSARSDNNNAAAAARPHTRVPRRDATFVVCDLFQLTSEWERRPHVARRAVMAFSDAVRSAAERSGGGGAHVFSSDVRHSGGTFFLAFHRPLDALRFVADVTGAAAADRLLARHARIGVSYCAGACPCPPNDALRVLYAEGLYKDACRACILAEPLQVVCSKAFVAAVRPHASAEQMAAFEQFSGGGPEWRLFDALGTGKGKDALDDAAAAAAETEADNACGDEDDDADDDEMTSHPFGSASTRNDAQRGLCSSNMCYFIISPIDVQIDEDQKIGEGSFGVVYLGRYKGSTPVAVKRINGRHDERALVDMRREAATLSGISHTNVVKLIGLMIDGDSMSLVMEYVQKGNLHSFIYGSGRLPLERRLAMLRDAAVGLEYLHSLGIVHRDVKPANLLVDDRLNVKVGDFGFARAKVANATVTRCGTPLWMAPEMIQHGGGLQHDAGAFSAAAATSASASASASAQSRARDEAAEKRASVIERLAKMDVYSFGILWWQMMTRKVPFDGINGMNVAMQVLDNKRPPIPGDVPADITGMIVKCWHRNPDKRPSMTSVVNFLNGRLNALNGV